MAHGDETARYPYRVVIADDERGIREGLEDFIRNECPSFQVTGVFADGRQALDHLEAQGATSWCRTSPCRICPGWTWWSRSSGHIRSCV